MPAEPSIVGKVHETTCDILPTWGLTALTDDVELMVDELGANAIVHGQCLIRLSLRVDAAADRPDGVLVCEVANTSPVMPTQPGAPARESDEHGRGLWIVEYSPTHSVPTPREAAKSCGSGMPFAQDGRLHESTAKDRGSRSARLGTGRGDGSLAALVVDFRINALGVCLRRHGLRRRRCSSCRQRS
ncbi:ATP-binding protein [Actinoallomurus sp. CA-142502]|uniref:ATP-binding protein n=1 Tax=Actinoallomurus sp. CA-142502 TaxID=3239885 RepID=UPI003D935C8D